LWIYRLTSLGLLGYSESPMSKLRKMLHTTPELTVLELCAGAGGQSLGLEQAGFSHAGLVEIDRPFCATLITNRPRWNVMQADLRTFDAMPYRGVDLVAAGRISRQYSLRD
jgi:hypothetical protein